MVRVLLDGSLAGWRAHARALAAACVSPKEIEWVWFFRLSYYKAFHLEPCQIYLYHLYGF